MLNIIKELACISYETGEIGRIKKILIKAALKGITRIDVKINEPHHDTVKNYFKLKGFKVSNTIGYYLSIDWSI